MELDVKDLNRIITDFESSREISAAELDLLEAAIYSGAVYGISKRGYLLLGMRSSFSACGFSGGYRMDITNGRGNNSASK